MSSVELPLVPSARSSSSSASSSRSHLHSAGSINSEKSARSVRSQRSQYQQEDEEEDGDESFHSADEAPHEDEEPQESSGGGLWDEVEHFLNKPSPSLSTLSGKTSKAAVNKPPKSTLPTLNARRASPDNQTTGPNRPARAAAAGPKSIDSKLLQEAFAYANQVQQLNFDDDDGDAEEQVQSWRNSKTKMLMQHAALGRANFSSSSSSLSSTATSSGLRGSRAVGGKPSSSANTDVRKKKGKPASSSAYSSAVKPKGTLKKKRSTTEDSPSSAGADPTSKSKTKGHMDPQTLQSLVSNFQNGTTLDELRRELAASQQSMAMSRQVLQEAAQNFFQSH
ncbi:hypothetical protein PR001_g17649 [Phytophthora rubi]|nr:hypothetical protein PR002_g20566 [Phytophthora rubi]KAE9004690.1 hypothetical protein PR001_g17649 [Phytophthora rubi]